MLFVNGMIYNKEKGYIALITILIISAVTLLVAINASLFGISESKMGLQKINSSKAFALTNLCAENALMNLKEDLSYSGNETSNIYDGSCTIYLIEGSGNNDRIVKVEGVFLNQKRRIKIDISEVNPTMIINSWQEVSTF